MTFFPRKCQILQRENPCILWLGELKCRAYLRGRQQCRRKCFTPWHILSWVLALPQESSSSLLAIRTEILLLQGLPIACARVVSKQVNCSKIHREWINSLHGYRFQHQSNKVLKSWGGWTGAGSHVTACSRIVYKPPVMCFLIFCQQCKVLGNK